MLESANDWDFDKGLGVTGLPAIAKRAGFGYIHANESNKNLSTTASQRLRVLSLGTVTVVSHEWAQFGYPNSTLMLRWVGFYVLIMYLIMSYVVFITLESI